MNTIYWDSWVSWGHTIRQAMSLDPDIYELVQSSPYGLWVALVIVGLASISEATGQSIILCINRVRPLRFIISLFLAIILRAVSYALWVAVVWLVVTYLFESEQSVVAVGSAVGLAYAPQLLAFFTLIPMLGMPFFSRLLSLWSMVAIVVAIDVGIGLSTSQAVIASGLGWIAVQIWRRTLGYPIYRLGHWIENMAAGVPLNLTIQDMHHIRHWQPTFLENWDKWWMERASVNVRMNLSERIRERMEKAVSESVAGESVDRYSVSR
ncbi:MAG: hypothetical protein AAF639_01515 [Chloroflexota bacterium]